MGYRKLLKEYMAHVQGVTGSNLVELGALTHAIEKRELGELRTIAAEIKRESFNNTLPTNDNTLVHAMLASGQLTLPELEALGVNEADAGTAFKERLEAERKASKTAELPPPQKS